MLRADQLPHVFIRLKLSMFGTFNVLRLNDTDVFGELFKFVKRQLKFRGNVFLPLVFFRVDETFVLFLKCVKQVFVMWKMVRKKIIFNENV